MVKVKWRKVHFDIPHCKTVTSKDVVSIYTSPSEVVIEFSATPSSKEKSDIKAELEKHFGCEFEEVVES